MYPPRFAVPDGLVSWDVPYPKYSPKPFTHTEVIDQDSTVVAGGWADGKAPARPSIEARGSYELQARRLPFRFDDKGRPLNPRGRTGLADRGKLGKWGPNHAGDAVVTRHVRRAANGGGGGGGSGGGGGAAGGVRTSLADGGVLVLEMVAIKRKDTGEWALPGGMQDPGEIAMQTLIREFKEEAGNVATPEEQAQFDAAAEDLFAVGNGRTVYKGYVDDPRNTDHAWMETVAMQ